MTEDALLTTLVSWLKLRSGLPLVIRDSLGKPRPSGPYGMVNLIRAGRVHEPAALEYEDNPEAGAEPFLQVPVIEWEWVVSFNVYAPGATDYARRVETAGSVQAGGESLLPLTLFSTSAIRRIPELINGVWEDRVQMDLTLRGMARDGVPVDVVETATLVYGASVNKALPTEASDTFPVGSITVTKP